MSSSRPLVVIGATGQLGSDLVNAAAAAGVEQVGLSHQDVDITDVASLEATLQRLRPAVVINSAAFHQVDRCEEDPAEAYRVNAVGAVLVARVARTVEARCVYISTDYVFDGNRSPGTLYSEDDVIAPLNVYGASKAAGEQLVQQSLSDHLVVRVSSLFGTAGARGKGGNFIETILKKARDGAPLSVVNDQWMTPTYTGDAAPAIVRLASGRVTGVVHVAGSRPCTWYDLASEALRLTRLDVRIEGVPAASYPSRVRRPRNSGLNTGRLASLLGAPLRSWNDALAAYLQAKGHLRA